MKVSVNIFPQAIAKVSSAQRIGVLKTAEQMIHEVVTAAIIPFDEGTLQNVSTDVDKSKLISGKVRITHNVPYAQRLYYHPEFNFNKSVNANAGGEWWEDWLAGSKKARPMELYKQFLRSAGGGFIR